MKLTPSASDGFEPQAQSFHKPSFTSTEDNGLFSDMYPQTTPLSIQRPDAQRQQSANHQPRENGADFTREHNWADGNATVDRSPFAPTSSTLNMPEAARVANDDMVPIADLMRRLRAPSSKRGYVVAILASLLWVVGASSLLGNITGYAQAGTFVQLSLLSGSQLALAAALLLAPIAFFFVVAGLHRRSQDMRRVAEAVTQVALRLAQPEAVSSEAVVSLSQTVRREVAAIGDGVERALARAGELETLVRSEISTMERAYADNEVRIRSLIDELVTQREAIVSNSDRVRQAITGAHQSLSQHLEAASETISTAVSEAGSRVTYSLGEKGELITLALGQAGDRMIDEITSRGGEIVNRLALTTDDVSVRLAKASDTISDTLEVKSLGMIAAIERTGTALTEGLNQGGQEINKLLSEAGTYVAETVARRALDVNNTLKSSCETLISALDDRSQEATRRIEIASSDIASTIAQQVNKLSESLADTGERIHQAVNINGGQLEKELSNVGQRIASLIEEKSEKAKIDFVTASGSVSETFSNRAQEIQDTLSYHAGEAASLLSSAGKEVTLAITAQATRANDALSRSVDTFTHTLETRSNTLVDNLTEKTAIFNTVAEIRTSELSQNLAQYTTMFSETAETRSKYLLDTLVEQITSFRSIAETQSHELQNTLTRYSENFSEAANVRGESLIDALDKHIGSFRSTAESQTQELNTTLQFHTARFAETTQDRVMELTHLLEGKTSSFAQMVENKTKALHEQIDYQSQHLAEVIETRGETLTSTLSQRADAFAHFADQYSNTLIERIVAHTQSFGDIAEAKGRFLEQQLEQQTRQLGSVIEGASIELAQGLNSRATHFIDAFTIQSSKIDGSLGDWLGRFEKTIVERGGSLAERIANDTGAFTDAIAARLETIEDIITTRGTALSDKLAQRTQEAVSAMADLIRTFEERTHIKGSDLEQLVEGAISRLHAAMDARTNILNEALAEKTVEIARVITQEGAQSAHSLALKADDFRQAVSMISDRLLSSLGGRAEDITVSITQASNYMLETLDERSAHMTSSLSQASTYMLETLDARSTQMTSSLNQASTYMLETLDERSAQMGTSLRNVQDELQNTLTDRSHDMSSSIAQVSAFLLDTLDSRSSELSLALRRSLEELHLSLESRTEEVSLSINRASLALLDSLGHKADEIGSAIHMRGEGLAQTLSAKAQEVNENLGSRAMDIANTLDVRITDFEDRVVSRLENVSALLDHRGRELDTVLTNRVDDLTQVFDERGARVVSSLKERGDAIASDVAIVGQAVVHAMESNSAIVSSALQTRTSELTNLLTTSGEALQIAINNSTSNAVSTLINTNDRLKNELSGVLDRLSDANVMLQHVIDSATQNLETVEDGLGERVKEIESILASVAARTNRASDEVATQVSALRSVSTGTLKDATELVLRLDEQSRSVADSTQEHVRALAEASGMLERIETRVAVSLTERRQTMEQMLGLISERTDDLDGITRSFSTLVEDSLRGAEERARQIGSLLSESAQTASSAINDQFEVIRDETGKERQKTMHDLRVSYEQVVKDMGEAMGKATERFSNAAHELRLMKTEILNELDATRQELQRGITDLPRETKETTAQMRRVVADQIEALNVLSGIVAKSGHDYEVVDVQDLRNNTPSPSRSFSREVSHNRPVAPRSVAAAPVAQSSLSQVSPYEAVPAPRKLESVNPTPSEAMPALVKENLDQVAKTATPHQGVSPSSDTPTEEKQLGGWIADLVKRASRQEGATADVAPVIKRTAPNLGHPAQSTPPVAQDAEQHDGASARDGSENRSSAIDNITSDIARMMDHQAVVDAWELYFGGELNPFTRRLYSLRGLQTLDEMQRNWRRDPAFRETLLRYTEEFEKLLTEVAQNDPDNTLAKTYLTSDTGKVYTMLAHASGRFEKN